MSHYVIVKGENEHYFLRAPVDEITKIIRQSLMHCLALGLIPKPFVTVTHTEDKMYGMKWEKSIGR